ncbi:hypothetical protein D3C77_517250 [compost metagenome]
MVETAPPGHTDLQVQPVAALHQTDVRPVKTMPRRVMHIYPQSAVRGDYGSGSLAQRDQVQHCGSGRRDLVAVIRGDPGAEDAMWRGELGERPARLNGGRPGDQLRMGRLQPRGEVMRHGVGQGGVPGWLGGSGSLPHLLKELLVGGADPLRRMMTHGIGVVLGARAGRRLGQNVPHRQR